MVRRKADKSLDECLKEGEAVSVANQPGTETSVEPCATPSSPTAKRVQPEVATEPSAVARAEVATTEDEAASWFWALLEQSGYERW